MQFTVYTICFFPDLAAHPRDRSSPHHTADARGGRGGGRVWRSDHRGALVVGTASASRGTALVGGGVNVNLEIDVVIVYGFTVASFAQSMLHGRNFSQAAVVECAL